MFESGAFVAEQLSPVDPEQVQPNGVDLTLDALFRQCEPGRIARDGKRVGERETVSPEEGAREGNGSDGDEAGSNDAAIPTYRLSPGGYVARYAETIAVPEGHVGFVYPRSSLMRNSCTIDTAVWDAGYRGRGEGLLEAYHEIEIERGARIAQFVLARAEHEGTYEGGYQGENIDNVNDTNNLK
ncbi:deoxyuridine 5'-triphosphate nucleotidohydrolase [Halobacteriales archaeon QS_3_64_16]|nr:MAG: deoxyuridine 5'-triphosphate nucleotidohydrolase [Halobacteriales archaeon QS_3_64_16]